ncbi:unnamed protein product [Adineta steineri]|uniref:Uncharacterized protein n=1 Tax=Adineta steineri TaxID=433720 RepID=A0A813R536_9BILA|nr:unnamed protein product [Adineta steineri]CAF0908119.1 unnamed protein product [Adineta steineri]
MSVIQKIATEAVETDLREMLAIITDTLAIRTLYLNDEKTREYRNRLDEAYGTHTAEYNELTKVEQIGEYINKHHSLLPVFAKDFIYSLSIASQGYDELSQASIYGQIADHLCKASTRNFHMAIRQNPQGELQFKKLLYKTKSYEHLAYYGELTSELLELIFALDPAIDDDEEIEQDILPFIITIANRSVLEQLYEKLMSKYSFERLLAGRLLVHLASCDAISAQEANDKILIAIQDSFAQQQMKWFHADNKDCRGHDGLAQQMGLMLLQLSFAHRNPLTSSSPLCHEPTFVFHYAKQIRNQVVCLFTTNEILHVVETDDSNDTHYIDDDNNNGDIGEDDVDGDIGEDDVDGDIGEDDSSG